MPIKNDLVVVALRDVHRNSDAAQALRELERLAAAWIERQRRKVELQVG